METRDTGLFIEALTLKTPSADRLVLSGSLHSPNAQAELAEHLARVHAEIVASGVAVFTVDLRKLHAVSSSAIRLFVTWISRAEASDYRLTFLVDTRVAWHRLSFSVLPALAPNTVHVIDHGDTAKGVTP